MNESKFTTSRRVLQGTSWMEYMKSKHTQEYINMKKVIISDCDGILTDGNMTYSDCRKEFKTYGCHDKELYKLAKSLGWEFVFVTDDRTGYEITDSRTTSSLGQHVYVYDGKSREKLVDQYKNGGYVTVFLGDSPSDLNAASAAHMCATTDNAFEPIKPYFNYVSPYQGGHGGFADIIYQLLLLDENDLKFYTT